MAGGPNPCVGKSDLGAESDEPDLEQSYDDFRKWLDDQDSGSDQASVAAAPAKSEEPKRRPAEPAKKDQVDWICKICKQNLLTDGCHLSWSAQLYLFL